MLKIILTLSSEEGDVEQPFDAPDDPLKAAMELVRILSEPVYSGPDKTYDAIVGFRWGRNLGK